MIVRVVKDVNYFPLNRAAVNDPRLSYKAIGIHTYLMSKPDHWEGNETDIVNRHSDGRAAVRSGIDELLAFGYLVRVRVVDKGKVAGWRLDTYETPAANPHYIDGQEPITVTEVLGEPEFDNRIVDSKPDSDNRIVDSKPECENRIVVSQVDEEKPQSDFLHVENRIHSNNTYTENNELQRDQSAYGTGAPAADSPLAKSLAEQFHELIEELRHTKNRPALLRQIYALCYGEHEDMPTYGYLGKAANAVGGAGRLAQLMWRQSTDPPKGDILAYLMARHKGVAPKAEPNPTSNRNAVHNVFAKLREQKEATAHG